MKRIDVVKKRDGCAKGWIPAPRAPVLDLAAQIGDSYSISDVGHKTEESLWLRFRRWLVQFLATDEEAATWSADQTAIPGPDLEGIRSQDVEEVERAKVLVERKLRTDFERNLREPVTVTALRLTGVDFFDDTTWELHPRVNLLLGRNGYGKSLLLRNLAGMLQREVEVTGELFQSARPDARIELELTRRGEAEKVERDDEVFLRDSAGEIPLLAIPDARFTDRSATTVSDPEELNLATDGAAHFLTREPYQAAVDGLLSGLALDYWEHGGTFELESFALLDEVVERLTGQEFRFSRIDRTSRTGSRIWVRTEALDRDLEIQRASQGTLSVIAIFGLVYAFLQELAGAQGSDAAGSVREQKGIVLIDEVDAHLHPVWQQKIRNLLTDTFPNVQFMLSAHSPLVVAGCGPGEVSILRKPEARFAVNRLDKDFVGVSSQELYRDIFDIEDLDEVFLEYVNRKARGEDVAVGRELDKLYAKEDKRGLSPEEDLRLKQLTRDRHRLERVAEVRETRMSEEGRALQYEAEISRLKTELAELRAARRATSS